MPVNTKYCLTRTDQIALCKEAGKPKGLFLMNGIVFFYRYAKHGSYFFQRDDEYRLDNSTGTL